MRTFDYCVAGVLFFLTIIFLPNNAFSWNWPKGTLPGPPNAQQYTYFHHSMSASNFYANGKKVDKNIDFDTSLDMLRYSYFTEELPFVKQVKQQIKLGFLLPTGKTEFRRTSINLDQSSSGIGDIGFAADSYLSLNKDLGLRGVFGLIASAPTGEYDKTKAINMGNNRWAFTPELGFAWQPGNWTLELYQAATFYTDNDEYMGDRELSTDPLYEFVQNVTYDIVPRKIWIGLIHSFQFGGETAIDSIDRNDSKRTKTVGAAFVCFISDKCNVLFGIKHDYSVECGPQITQGTIRFNYFVW